MKHITNLSRKISPFLVTAVLISFFAVNAKAALVIEMNAAAQDENLLLGSALARACRYALHLRPQLRRSLENGTTEIDNNRCEQSIRPIARGRKNWLHVGSPAAAPSVAAIISAVVSCKRLGINVRTYLTEVLPQLAAALPDKLADIAAKLTPTKWLAARKQAAAAAAPAAGENPQ